MKIAVDARELADRPTGVGRYLAQLFAEWARSPETGCHDWMLYSHQPADVPPPFGGHVRVVPGNGGSSWEQWTLTRALAADNPDVLFAPGYTAPLRAPCPVVLTVHDVSFAAHPEWFTFQEGTRRRTFTRLSARRAQIVLTDSQFSRGEIVRHLKVHPEKVRVISLGVRATAAGREQGRSEREPLVLFVGSIFTRRHVDALIRAFSAIVAPRVPGSRLEIVGENRSHPFVDLSSVMTRQPVDTQRRVSIRSYIDDDTLSNLYARASVFAFPSEYEGFGLTPLEALAAGVPSVMLDTPIASEIMGPAACYVPLGVTLEADLGETIVRLLTNETAREDVLRHAPAMLARYRWDQAAAETFAVLSEVGGA